MSSIQQKSPTDFKANDDTNNLINQIKQAADNKTPIRIEGNGTKRQLGHSINSNHAVVSTRAHSGIINYDPVELVMTARAGTTLAEIDAVLAENQQTLACDPARFNGQATIGGSLATNQAGPSRPWLGSLRDHVLGVNLINGKGEYLRFGGKVMKNVAGYDVSRLQAGAMGTLGLMTEISVKVLPFASASMTVRQALSQAEAISNMNLLAGQPTPLSAASWVNGYLYLQFSGAQSAVENAVNSLVSGTVNKKFTTASRKYNNSEILSLEQASDFWTQLRDQQLDFFNNLAADESLWRFSINPTAWDDFSNNVDDKAWLADWGGALRWLKGDFNQEKLSDWAQRHGGEVTLFAQSQKQSQRDSQNEHDFTGAGQITLPPINPVIQRIQTNIKNSFDPNRILNIGRLYHWS
ncbi:glycolate oxidase subunit GlcE [Colwellia ponticola]|uniref:Glycolate oxidase subunit GlcE n=1 Tax=Colwellia ponticola TaxID=2304625 RepID=A0A8H2PNT2_9GAMM|nr:glycolate oxidase subunit GlcE [Colwellia ponticola]TMM47012.1 glycolate oxidase subunit GlcE [Colwellia ponticola]